MSSETLAFIGLGANLEDPLRQLRRAARRLAAMEKVEVAAASSMYRTEPVGPVAQAPFVNAVLALRTALGPGALLDALLGIEARMGRVRGVPGGPRLIDLDLLLHEDRVIRGPRLHLPHPRMHERRFVLAPLAEIAPAARHPVLGGRAEEMLAALGGGGPWVERLAEGWGPPLPPAGVPLGRARKSLVSAPGSLRR